MSQQQSQNLNSSSSNLPPEQQPVPSTSEDKWADDRTATDLGHGQENAPDPVADTARLPVSGLAAEENTAPSVESDTDPAVPPPEVSDWLTEGGATAAGPATQEAAAETASEAGAETTSNSATSASRAAHYDQTYAPAAKDQTLSDQLPSGSRRRMLPNRSGTWITVTVVVVTLGIAIGLIWWALQQ